MENVFSNMYMQYTTFVCHINHEPMYMYKYWISLMLLFVWFQSTRTQYHDDSMWHVLYHQTMGDPQTQCGVSNEGVLSTGKVNIMHVHTEFHLRGQMGSNFVLCIVSRAKPHPLLVRGEGLVKSLHTSHVNYPGSWQKWFRPIRLLMWSCYTLRQHVCILWPIF